MKTKFLDICNIGNYIFGLIIKIYLNDFMDVRECLIEGLSLSITTS